MAQDRHEPLRATDQDQAEAGSLAFAIGGGVRRVVVPDDVGLLTAEFTRRGPDLAIGNPDAPALVVLDYFVADTAPDLATGGGAVLPGRIIETLAGPDVSPGAGPEAAPAQAAIGHVEQLDGEVVVIRADGGRTVASEGTPVFQDDVVTTDAGGAVGLRFVDGMTLSLGSDARMVLDEFAYDPATHQGGGVIDVIQGAFSFVSGKAAHVGLDSLVIDTPTMTIGIRGTKVVAQAAAEGETTTVVLLPEDDGTIGKIMIGTDAGQELLEQPFVSTTVVSRDLPPAPQTFVAPDWVASKFAKPLAFLPPEHPQSDSPARTPHDRGDVAPLSNDLEEAEAAALGEQATPRDWSGKVPEAGSPAGTTEAAHPGGDVALSLQVAKEDEASDRAGSEPSPQDPDLPPMFTVEGQAKTDVSEARDANADVIADTNDAPVVVAPIGDTGSAEDAAFVYDVAGSFGDPEGQSLTFGAEQSGGVPLPPWLAIDPATGVLTGNPGNGDVGGLTVDVTATDSSGATATSSFQLTVTNTNDAPVVVTPIADTASAEDAAFSYGVAASFADVDVGDTPTFGATLVGGAPLPAWLAIDPATGVLTGTPANGDVGHLTLDVTATDAAGASATSTFQLTVTNSNDAPVVVTPIGDTAIAEDAAFSYDVAASFADVDTIHGDTLTYSAELTGGAPLPAWLAIDPATGVLSGTPANGDVDGLSVDVTATDGSGVSATSSFQLTVTNTNDAPVVVTPIADTASAEDAAFSYDVAASFADVDVGDTPTFGATLAGGAPLPAWLAIDPNTGVLSGTPANGDVGALTVDVTATDGSGATATSSFQLTVTNSNDAPVVVTPIPDASPTQSIPFTYDASPSFADADVIHGDTVTYDAQQAGGAPLPAWLAIDPATGVLSGTPGAADVGATFVVEVTATDAIGASATTGFQVTVDNMNDAPVVVVPIGDIGSAEDVVFSYDVSGSFNDPDGEPVTFSAEQSGGAPLPAWLSIDAATGVLSGTPANGDVGGLIVDVTATDGSGATATSSFQLTVTNTNDAPVVVTPIVDTATAEDAAFSYDAAASFADADTIHGDTLTFSAEQSGGAPLPAWLSIDAATGVLSGTPANGDVGGLTVDVTATDGAGATTTSSFQLTVTNTNDAPVVVTPIADTATAEDAAFSYDVTASFADVDVGDTPTFGATLSGGTPLPAWLAIDPATGILSGTPANSDVGGLTIDVTATDGSGATATSSFQLTVTNTNDAPVVVTPIADTATAEDAAFSYDVAASFADVDVGDTPTFGATLSGGTPLPAWLAIDPATGILSGTPANGDVGSLTVDVTATDGAGATTTSSFQLTVTNTNDAPVLDDAQSPSMTAVAASATDPGGDTVADIVVDGSITDVDGPAVEAIAVIGVDETNGTWEYSTDGGSNWSAVGAVADNSARLLDASGRLRFVPDPGFSGNATFTFRAWDQTVGSSGEIVDASVNGGTTAYSATSDTGSIAVVGTDLNLSSGSEFQISTTTTDAQRFPSIAALGDGGFVTVWQSNNQDGDAQGIFGQRFDAAGNPAGVEFQINTYTTEGQQIPSVAGLDSGGFVVTWQSKDQDGDVEGIFGQRFDAAGSPSGVEFQINTQSVKEQQSPSVAALDGGGFVVTWQSMDQDGDTWGIYGQRFDTAGSPQSAEFQINTETALEQQSPSVAALDDGGFVVTWQSKDQDGDTWGIYGQRYDAAGIAQGAEFQVNSETAMEQQSPSVAALADGGFVVAWQSKDQDGDKEGICGQRFDAAGNPVEFEFQINTTVANEQQDPSIIGLADGGFLVTWASKDQDGDNWGVYGQRFDADGDALGQEFQINTTTADAQWHPTVTALADGDVVAAWTSRNQDGDSGGVFGHHYENETASVTVNPPAAAATSVLDFGGTNSAVDAGDPGLSFSDLDPGSRDFTVEAWFHYAGPNGIQTIVSKGNATEVDPGFNVFLDGSELVVRVTSVAGEAAASKLTMSGAAGWYHVAMVIDQEAGSDASRVEGYLDGSSAGWSAGHGTVLDDTFTTPPGGISNGDRFLVGAVYDAGVAADFFDSEIADVRVWNTARSAAEIQADLGRTLNGDEDHLIANWRLDDGAGGIAVDAGPSAYDGIVAFGATWESATGFTIARDTSVGGRISATDPEGDALSYGIAAAPANGSAAIDSQSGTWTYTPDPGYAGADSVSYQVSDGNGGIDTVNIAITVTP